MLYKNMDLGSEERNFDKILISYVEQSCLALMNIVLQTQSQYCSLLSQQYCVLATERHRDNLKRHCMHRALQKFFHTTLLEMAI